MAAPLGSDSGAAKPLPAEHPSAHIHQRCCVSQRAGRPIPCTALRINADPPAEGFGSCLKRAKADTAWHLNLRATGLDGAADGVKRPILLDKLFRRRSMLRGGAVLLLAIVLD